ncbi:MAG: hypothetical protein O0X93_08420 [Methanocorpusculum sp.]|nr:hypothetical protein [Methanocorpusculum sp.]MDE2523162.1 hypothetical protein [Methanocorpusculum sp.]MDE2525026.1 hypothetical protein [Methanocorpusculum sp.]
MAFTTCDNLLGSALEEEPATDNKLLKYAGLFVIGAVIGFGAAAIIRRKK